MVKFIVLALLLVVTGCAGNNNMTQKQVTPEQTPISSHNHADTSDSALTQASSTATPGTGTLTTKNSQNGITLDLIDLIQSPTGNPVKQAPTGDIEKNVPTTPAGQAQEGNKDATNNKNSSQFGQQVLDLVNQERSKAGLGALSMDDQLTNMATVKAQDMIANNYFDHNSPTYGSPFDMMKEFGITYKTAGENIAKGQTTASQVMQDWMNSPGHKANIMNSSYTHIGVGYYNNAWVQEFKS